MLCDKFLYSSGDYHIIIKLFYDHQVYLVGTPGGRKH